MEKGKRLSDTQIGNLVKHYDEIARTAQAKSTDHTRARTTNASSVIAGLLFAGIYNTQSSSTSTSIISIIATAAFLYRAIQYDKKQHNSQVFDIYTMKVAEKMAEIIINSDGFTKPKLTGNDSIEKYIKAKTAYNQKSNIKPDSTSQYLRKSAVAGMFVIVGIFLGNDTIRPGTSNAEYFFDKIEEVIQEVKPHFNKLQTTLTREF